jgi:hypothetical protein
MWEELVIFMQATSLNWLQRKEAQWLKNVPIFQDS